MRTLFLAASLIAGLTGSTAGSPPGDEFLYLHSRADRDGFAPADSSGQGDFDGHGAYFSDDLLPSTPRFTVRSDAFGNVVFLRPRTGAGEKNFVTPRGQRIPISTRNVFDAVLVLGSAHDGHHSGDVIFEFQDGSKAKSSLGLSDWALEPRFGEETAFEGVYRQGTTNVSFRTRLWIQRISIPEAKVLRSITLPRLPKVAIASISLVRRDGYERPALISSPPASAESASVAIFAEPGFPSLYAPAGLSPELVRGALEAAGISAALVPLATLQDRTVLEPSRYPVVVNVYGGAFPVAAAPALAAFADAGGVLVHVGAPYALGVTRTSSGEWLRWVHAGDASGAGAGLVSPFSLAASTFDLRAPVALGSAGREFVVVKAASAHGYDAVPWPRYRAGTDALDGTGPWALDARISGTLAAGLTAKFTPLVHGRFQNARNFALAWKVSGPNGERLEICTASSPLLLDGAVADVGLHADLIVKSAAFALNERGRIDRAVFDAIRTRAWEPSSSSVPVPRVDVTAKHEAELFTRRTATAASVHRLALAPLTPGERILAASAQGLLHRDIAKNGVLFLDASGLAANSLAPAIAPDELARAEPIDLAAVLGRVGHRRAVIVDPELFGSLDLATMAAAVEGALVAYPAAIETHSLEIAVDLRGLFSTYEEMLAWSERSLRPHLDSSLVVLSPPESSSWELRDLVIAKKAPIIWLPTLDQVSVRVSAQAAELDARAFLATLPPLTRVVVGARAGGTSSPGARLARSFGSVVHELGAADNASLLGGIGTATESPNVPPPRVIELDPAKVYIAVVGTPLRLGNAGASAAANSPPLSPEPTVPADPTARRAAAPAAAGIAAAPAPVEASAGVAVTTPATAPTAAPVVALAPSFEAGFAAAFPVAADRSRKGRSAPPGVLIARSGLDGFAHAFGSRRDEILTARFRDLAREIESLGASHLMIDGDPSSIFDVPTISGLYSQLAENTAIVITHDANSSPSVLTASELIGGRVVLHVLEAAAITAALDPTARSELQPLFPLFFAIDEATYSALASQGLLGGDGIVVGRIDEIAPLARSVLADRHVRGTIAIDYGAEWRYHDRGSEPGATWKVAEFDDSKWSRGKAKLGYGDGSESTRLSFGENAQTKHPSYYFRSSFSVSDPAQAKIGVIDVVVDDGCVVYLNGKEVLRDNMPAGDIAFSTLASRAKSGSAETARVRRIFSTAGLISGENTLAVEVHQSGATSSDLGFDLRLGIYSTSRASDSGTN
jgi:hypothetical protein